jgi:hypothetical protein
VISRALGENKCENPLSWHKLCGRFLGFDFFLVEWERLAAAAVSAIRVIVMMA